MGIQQMLLGVGAKDKIYIDNIFSTNTWRGTNATKTITNGIDLAGEGGMTWIKTRDQSSNRNWAMADTVRGTNKIISSDSTDEQKTISSTVQAFNSNGFELGGAAIVNWNTVGGNGDKYVGYTFRKQEKFFTIKQYTGTGSTQSLTHDLGSVPGCIFVKKLSGSPKDWGVYHRGQNGGTDPEDYRLRLNTTATENNDTYWGDTAPTATHFTVGDAHDEVNVSGETYIAYLFGHGDAAFGESGDQSIIKCGTYTTDGNEDATVNLGWEPQWILAKRVDSTSAADWMVVDTIRGIGNAQDVEANASGAARVLEANTTDVEVNSSRLAATPTGFFADQFGSNRTFVYMAIRRPDAKVGKPADAGTDVFALDTGNGSSLGPCFDSTFSVDFALKKVTGSTAEWWAVSRLTDKHYLQTNGTNASSTHNDNAMDYEKGWANGSIGSGAQSWMWKRHAGFDVVTYKGNGSARQISHSLSKSPEMIWIKCRDNTFNWKVYHKGANGGTNPEQYYFRLNHNDAEATSSTMWNNTAPTSTAFTIGSAGGVNNNNNDFIAMLFASVDGISKVGYYTGSSSDQTITTGFTPRFLMVKRANGSGDWYVIDTVMGNLGSSGNDTAIYLNKDESEGDLGANYVNTTSTGFVLPGNIAGDFHYITAKYIYYAHA